MRSARWMSSARSRAGAALGQDADRVLLPLARSPIRAACSPAPATTGLLCDPHDAYALNGRSIAPGSRSRMSADAIGAIEVDRVEDVDVRFEDAIRRRQCARHTPPSPPGCRSTSRHASAGWRRASGARRPPRCCHETPPHGEACILTRRRPPSPRSSSMLTIDRPARWRMTVRSSVSHAHVLTRGRSRARGAAPIGGCSSSTGLGIVADQPLDLVRPLEGDGGGQRDRGASVDQQSRHLVVRRRALPDPAASARRHPRDSGRRQARSARRAPQTAS